jgi:hypothetical protein
MKNYFGRSSFEPPIRVRGVWAGVLGGMANGCVCSVENTNRARGVLIVCDIFRYREHISIIRGIVPKKRLLEWSVEDAWEPLCKVRNSSKMAGRSD